MTAESYHIKLPQFEGPFDLLLFFIERDELDIYNIPITKITNDFLDYIPDRLVEHGSIKELHRECEYDAKAIADTVREMMKEKVRVTAMHG